jgi:hypothetical protein
MDPNIHQESKEQVQKNVEQITPQQKQPGKIALQVFALALLLSIVAYGVYAWQNSRVAKLETQVENLAKNSDKNKDAATDPYAGWKSYTTKNEKITFKYPSNYRLKTEDSGSNGISYPGMDVVQLTSPTGYVTSMSLGISGIGGACVDSKVALAEKVVVTGRPMYINYVDTGDGYVSSILLARSPEFACLGGFMSENVYADPEKTQQAANLVSASSDSYKVKSVNEYKNNADVKNAVLIIKSMSY